MRAITLLCSTLMVSPLLVSPLLVSQARADDIQKAADDVCKCMEKPNAVAREVMQAFASAQASGDLSKLDKYQAEMTKVMESSVACMEALPKKYPQIDRDDVLKRRVMDMAKQQCPNPASSLLSY